MGGDGGSLEWRDGERGEARILGRTRGVDSTDRGGGRATFHRRPRGGGGIEVKLRDLLLGTCSQML
jgi:hypothetical protein